LSLVDCNYEKDSGQDGFNELQFTGNWFIDAGILGFVNLMEEVYGWDLEELQRRVREEPEVVYYGYFPFAYFYKLSQKENEGLKARLIHFVEQNKELGKDILEKIWWDFITELFREVWIRKKLEIMHESKCYDKKGKVISHYDDIKYRELIKNRELLVNKLVNDKSYQKFLREIFGKRKKLAKNRSHNLSSEDIKLLEDKLDSFQDEDFRKEAEKVIEKQKELEDYLIKAWDNLKSKGISRDSSVFYRIPIDSSFFKNYLFFNSSRGIFEQLEDLRNLLDGNTSYSEYLSKIDRAVSKFLPSDEKFPNITYTEFRAQLLAKEAPYLFVYLINFLNAFTFVRNVGSILFYSSDLNLTYHVNKKIKTYLSKNEQASDLTILRVTWQSIIDTIMETETVWTLENMYLIRYERLSQQDLIGVEYIGVPKLQANILIDDTLRNALNKNIPVKASNGRIEKRAWILEEFVKNKPLLPHLIHHLHIFLADRIDRRNYAGKGTLVYANIVDAKIREFGGDNILFGKEFFKRYNLLLTEIKEDAKLAFWISNLFRDLFESQDERKGYANLLLTTIRRSDKYRFVNMLLKIFIDKKGKNENIKNLINFTFNKILPNDLSWKNYALILVAGLIGGGEPDGEE